MTTNAVDVPPATDLMPLLDFTPTDLEANRRGELGADQRARLAGLQRRALLLGGAGFFFLALVAATLLFIGQRNGSLVLSLMGIFVTIINALWVGVFGRQWMRLRVDIATGAIEPITGELERVVRANGQANNFVLRVNDTDFSVKKETFKQFRHEVTYHFYRAPHSGILLAAEPA